MTPENIRKLGSYGFRERFIDLQYIRSLLYYRVTGMHYFQKYFAK